MLMLQNSDSTKCVQHHALKYYPLQGRRGLEPKPGDLRYKVHPEYITWHTLQKIT